jgi:hypothetical protein
VLLPPAPDWPDSVSVVGPLQPPAARAPPLAPGGPEAVRAAGALPPDLREAIAEARCGRLAFRLGHEGSQRPPAAAPASAPRAPPARPAPPPPPLPRLLLSSPLHLSTPCHPPNPPSPSASGTPVVYIGLGSMLGAYYDSPPAILTVLAEGVAEAARRGAVCCAVIHTVTGRPAAGPGGGG